MIALVKAAAGPKSVRTFAVASSPTLILPDRFELIRKVAA